MIFALRLQLQTQPDTTHGNAIQSTIQQLADDYRSVNGLTARQAVIYLMECTTMIPGVFCVQMLSWRSKLQDIVHHPVPFAGFSSLQYTLPLSLDEYNNVPSKVSVGVQTKLVNPNVNQIAEFHQRQFDLDWVLKQ